MRLMWVIFEEMFSPERPPDARRRSQLAFGIVLVLIGALVGGFLWLRKRDATTITDRHGQRVTISELWRDRRVLVVLFADRTCRSCREELKQLNAHQAELGVPVVGVSSDTPPQLERLRKELEISLELYSGAPLALARYWNVELTGLTYDRRTCDAVLLVEPSGQISYRSGCGYPELSTLIAATHQAVTRTP